MLIEVPIKTWADNKKLTVVNFLGGPGTGKSFLAGEVLQLLKRRQLSAQYVEETAKGCVWDNRAIAIQDPLYLLGNQYHALRRLVYHNIDIAVLDSSLLLNLLYRGDEMPSTFDKMVVDAYKSFNNINILVSRLPHLQFEQTGRNQDLHQSMVLDTTSEQLLNTLQLPYIKVTSYQADDCVKYILAVLNNINT